jgi:hypothetical protein
MKLKIQANPEMHLCARSEELHAAYCRNNRNNSMRQVASYELSAMQSLLRIFLVEQRQHLAPKIELKFYQMPVASQKEWMKYSKMRTLHDCRKIFTMEDKSRGA